MGVRPRLLDTSLLTFSAVTVAKTLWDDQNITKKIDKFSGSIYQFCEDQPFKKEGIWCHITDKVVKKLEKLNINIPPQLLVQLQHVICVMADNIYRMLLRWLDYGEKLKMRRRPIQKFYFTQHGLIDELKIYQDWKNNYSVINQCEQIVKYFMEFCLYADETVFDRETFRDIAVKISAYFDLNREIVYLDQLLALLLIWYELIFKNNDVNAFYFEARNLENQDWEYRSFVVSVELGFEKMVDHFYKKLDENDREDKIVAYAHIFLQKLEQSFNVDRDYKRTAQMILNLMQKMSLDRKIQFVSLQKLNLFTVFLKTWPNQLVSLELLDYILEDLDIWAVLEKAWDYLFKFSKFSSLNVETNTYHGVFRQIIRKILAKMSLDTKLGFFSPYQENDELFELFKISDFLSIKAVISDDDLKERRSELIDITKFLIDYTLQINYFPAVQINKYMNALEFSESEKLVFFQFFSQPSLFDTITRLGRFKLADEILLWLCGSKEKADEKRKEIRKSFDHMSVYSKMVDNCEYDSAEVYLKWLCNEDYETVQNSIFSFEFISEKFWFIWIKTFASHNFNSCFSMMECYKFLVFYCKSEDLISWFKNEVGEKVENSVNSFCVTVLKFLFHLENKQPSNPSLVGESLNINSGLWLRLTDSINFEAALNEGFDFCSVSSDKINETKRKMRGNVDWWFGLFGTNKFEFLILNSLIEWFGFEEEEKKTVVKNFIESEKGAMLCLKILGSKNDGFVDEAARTILNRDWVKKYGDIEKIKNELKEIKNEPDCDVSRVINVLGEL